MNIKSTKDKAMKVGELAKQTGISIRTLHYYDEIGLLSPSERTESDYRLYSQADIIRLQQIISLRQLGFSLMEIKACLQQPDFSLQHTIQLHIARLREQIELSQKLLHRLEALAANSQTSLDIDTLIQTIEVMTMFEKYYTPEQLEALKQRQELLGEELIHQVENEWEGLIAQARLEMEKGTDPASETVQNIAKRWQELIAEFTGGNPGIEQSLNNMYQQEGVETASRGMGDAALWEYMGRALA
ncbi:MAG: MerR family transcriptional regulator [Tolypothrix brevis GSE-NOS-MK-07-07A]|jgi:DNA-binding transcriptional MerR regulator|nr:MerR family transcriptional regulator [Tolypothrix brevis GSE-NOS-MK-07-07A]